MRRAALLVVLVALETISACKKESARQPASVRPSTLTAEYFAWEKTPSGHFKQVKKDYFMNKKICRNVIDVLNGMSTQQPRSNWILSHTTDSSFECWPAFVDPNDYYKQYSIHSDSPAEMSPVTNQPDASGNTQAPN